MLVETVHSYINTLYYDSVNKLLLRLKELFFDEINSGGDAGIQIFQVSLEGNCFKLCGLMQLKPNSKNIRMNTLIAVIGSILQDLS